MLTKSKKDSKVTRNIEAWIIPHPGTREPVVCNTFLDCMIKWFEGTNIPRKTTAVSIEDFDIAHARVKGFLKERMKK